jgi:hypothetical protein
VSYHTQLDRRPSYSPGQCDVTYYKEIYSFARSGKMDPNIFACLVLNWLCTTMSEEVPGAIGNQGKWTSSFASA